MEIIPPNGNEQQFAVAHISNNEVIMIAPEEYARSYCSRANEDLPRLRFYITPYTGKPFAGPRHPQSSFMRNEAIYAPRIHDTTNGVDMFPTIPSVKDKVKEYLKKTA